MTRRRWLVSGMVQGVGFRAFVAREAGRIGVRGMVRNLADGRVEVVAEGGPEALDLLRGRLLEGPRLARVSNVENAEILVDVGPLNSFSIM